MENVVTLASLFDGIGGALLCAERCGAAPIWASEIEPFPIKVTKYHFPNVKHYGDITKINGTKVEPVDIIVGGSPCQDLSVAGLRKGMKHEDFGDEETTRSGLFMEQIRIIKEMRSAGTNKPRFMVWENVPGAFSSKGAGDQLQAGDAFRIILEETARVADSSISIPRSPSGWANSGSVLGDGFSISWRTVDAQYWGVPQRRRRIYLVADFGGQSAPEILFEQPCVPGNSAESGNEGQGIAGDVKNSVGATVFSLDSLASNSMKSDNPFSGCHVTETSKCIDTTNPDPSKNQGGVAIVQPVICLQGNGIDRADTAGCNGKGWTEDVCYTLNTINRPAVFESHPMDSRITGPVDVCPTVTNHFHKGGADTPLVLENHPQDSRVTGPLDVANSVVKQYGTGGGNVPFVMDPMSAAFREGSFGDYVEGEFGTLKKSGGVLGGGSETFIKQNAVRRLTPLECERLQGYPDNYTNIPGASDSARYKALGNSFAIPNAEYVIRGCAEVLRRAAHDNT